VFDLWDVSSDLEYIAKLLLYLYDGQGLAIQWLKCIMDQEIDSTENIFVLFRGNSLFTKALDLYMKLCCSEYLASTLGVIIWEICDSKISIEVDPTRLDRNEDIKMNWKRLIAYSINIWDCIEKSRSKMPRELRTIFDYLQRQVIKRFNQAREDKYTIVRYTSVSGFLFLRLFCPAILGPKVLKKFDFSCLVFVKIFLMIKLQEL
jgi:hypothetical protein